jgi:hypothetical protein
MNVVNAKAFPLPCIRISHAAGENPEQIMKSRENV